MTDWKNWKSCTDATGSDGEELAKFRLYREGAVNYLAKRMDSEQLHKRQMYMRKALADFPEWENLSNEELNDIRLYRVGSGYIVENSNGYEFMLRSGKVTLEETAFRKARAMMPFEFIGLTGKDFCWSKYKTDIAVAKDMINKYIVKYPSFKTRGVGLYIYSGTKGSGKTMLACCLLNEIANRYAGSVKFVNILDFLEMTKKGFYDGDDDTEAVYKAGLLVMDDIGVQMAREWIETVLYRLINERYVNKLPTVYTSNIPIEHLKMDDRITDRIESTTFHVSLPEEAVRKAVRQQEKKKLLEEIENAP